MARRWFPEDRGAFVFASTFGQTIRDARSRTATVYTDSGGTTLADLLDADSVSIGAIITVGEDGLWPLFQGPDDLSDTVYVKPQGSTTLYPMYARLDDRVDALESGKLDITAANATYVPRPTGFTSLIAAPNVVFNVKDYGALGNNVADDTAAFTAAIAACSAAGGGVVYAPAGNYRLTSLTVTSNAVVIRGAGIFFGTTLRCTATTGNVVTFSGAQHSGIEDLLIDYTGRPTAGFAVAFTNNAYQCYADNVRVNQGFGGVQVNGGTEIRLKGINLRQLYGPQGFHMTGTAGVRSYRAVLDDIVCDSPYVTSPAITSVKTYANSTAYAVGDVVRIAAAGIYQVVTAGTSAASGTGPTGGTFTTNVTDGTVQWRYICNADLTWIQQDSYFYSLVINKAALLNGYNGFVQSDTAAAGSSYPIWAFVWGLEVDHSFQTGVRLIAGEGCYIGGSWLGSSLTANGAAVVGTHRGEVAIYGGTRIMGNAQHGVLLNSGPTNTAITGCFIGDNSVLTLNTYHGITVGSNATRFTITGNIIGDLAGGVGNLQGYAVLVSAGTSDYYSITGNLTHGNGLGDLSDGGTGFNKRVDILGGGLALPIYTVAGLPPASGNTGRMAYASNETGGAVPVFSDGTNWRRVTDRAIAA